ncbi:uncharacterized protein CDAR_282781 [Caerostris darwini]|uniref:Uncharacterized protein n=1 Tax=Caerostris darwini TaxID=1538125 RepID=A0AAV4W8X6_9ARAC|nr:uncharacterized protein CDAR_282781 [Caerostris darwini]
MFFALVGILLLSLVSACPEDIIPPCSCRPIGTKTNEVTCTGADDVQTFDRSLAKYRGESIRTLYVMDSYLLYFPSKVFEGLNIEKLHLINSNFRDFSDSEVAFEGLENSLKSLVIQRCTVFDGWTWKELGQLKSLTWLKTVKAGLDIIDSDISDIAHLNLEVLELTQDTVSYIDDKAFSTFANLKVLSLKMNQISKLKRSMFPNPARELSQINLSYNEIERLPEDIFTNMPSLISLILGKNKLLTLDENTFAPAWKCLNKFDISDNPLRCDCGLKWISKGHPKTTRGACSQPPSLNGTKLADVKADDLRC